ncbi:S8 family serine peptidase [Patescibacteria group bacterium]|nr:S8 family serine peptidase [Patescibacteria group bacterium]
MFFRNKKIKILFILLLVAGGSFAAMLLTNEKSDTALARLNSKYGLVFAEPLDGEMDSSLMALFNPHHQFLRASLTNILKPKKELILKLNGENPASAELQNALILNFKTDSGIRQIIADYENLDLVQYAEPNFDLTLPEDEAISAADSEKEEASKIMPENEAGVLVAVIDSGVDGAHPDFGNRVISGWNFLENTSQVIDQNGHGTHVAGIILRNSAAAKIMPLKISDGDSGKMQELVRAIKFAADNGAQIINLSLGLQSESKILREAIDYADKKNVIVVAVAGNYRSGAEYYPAALPNVIAVSALKKNGEKLFWSNFGEWVDFSVVAQDVWSAAPDQQHAYRTGTSQAAPIVSAKISEILNSSGETLDFQQVYDYLVENSEPISSRYELGRQIFN